MQELKKNVMEVIDKVNQDWVNALKEADEKDSELDLSQMMGKFSENIKKLDVYFRDAAERQKPKKKGIFNL